MRHFAYANYLRFNRLALAKSLGLMLIVALANSGCEKQGGGGDPGNEATAGEESYYDWPLFRGDPQMQGVSKESLAPPLQMKWSFEPPVEEGKKRPPIDASPVVAGGRVFVGTQDGHFYGINLEDGSEIWSFKAEGPISAPAAVLKDRVFVGDTYGFIYALDVKTGEERWRFETEGKIEGGVNTYVSESGSEEIFVGSHDYFLYCLNAATGEVVWKHETGNYVVATPSLIELEGREAVSFGGCDGILHVVSASGEGEAQEIEIGSYIANTSAVRDGIAYVAHNGGEVLAIDIESGETAWRIDTKIEYTASPAVDEANVYIAGPDKRLVAYDRVMGAEQWAFRATRALSSSPVVCGDTIWQGGMDGRLYAINKADGTESWNFDLGAQIKASPAVSRGVLVICGDDGVVYSFSK